MCKILLSVIIFLLSYSISNAEIYKDFTPYKSLKLIKESYPNGRFEEVKAAWVKGDDGFYKLTGTGLSGTLYLAFYDQTNFYKKSYLDVLGTPEVDGLSDDEKAKQQNLVEYWKLKDDLGKDEKLALIWVRWVPDEAVPFDRLKSRYGNAEKCSYNEENFTPTCTWDSKALSVNLSDDKKLVFSIDYNFTQAELTSTSGIKNQETDLPKSEPRKSKKKR